MLVLVDKANARLKKLHAGEVSRGAYHFDRKIRLGCRMHNGKRFTSLPQNCHIRYGLNPKKGAICVV